MITIQGFAKICGCSTQTLRYYDRIDLLNPVKVDKWTGYRYYEEEQALLFVKIKKLQQADFSIEEIKSGSWSKFRKYKDPISKKKWKCRK